MQQQKAFRLTFIAAAIAVLPMVSIAQELERVTVTATKREAVLTDVSLAISSLSSIALEARNINSLEDLGANAVGMDIIKTGPGENQLVSRGISTTQTLSIQSGPAVGVYIDEMPLTGMNSGVPDFGLWDVSRVEMLRGPQGTLYGEGAMAGTIRIITNAPDSKKLSTRFQVTGSKVDGGSAGNSVRGMLNVPLSDGVAAIRATVSRNQEPAWIDAPELKMIDANTNVQTDSRVALRVTPNDRLKIDASVWYQDSNTNHNGNQTSPGVYSPPSLGPIKGSGIAPTANGQLNTDARSGTQGNLTVNYDFGAFSLVSATSFARQDSDFTLDAGDTAAIALATMGVPAQYLSAVLPGASVKNRRKRSLDQSTQELRLVSNGDQRFNWTAGGYFKKLDRHVDNFWNIHAPGLANIGAPALHDDSLVISDTSTKAQALFGEADWKLTDTITVTGGVRSYTDDRSASANVVNFSSVFGVPVGTTYNNATDKKTTYNAILSWKPSDKINIFARVASGFRSGGPNYWQPDPVNILKSFEPESILSYELGFKSNPTSWLVANVNLYTNDWKDKQVPVYTPSGLHDYIGNAGSAKSNGVEMEFQVYPTQGLSLNAGVTYTDATITTDLLGPRNRLIAASGSRLAYVAPWEIKASADYRWPMADGRGGVFNLALVHRDANFSDISNADWSNNGRLNLINLRTGVEANKKAWGVYFYVKNLSNERSITTIQKSTSDEYGVRYSTYVQPRTIGVEFQAGF
jgi:iron complex outermembrane receptor protein